MSYHKLPAITAPSTLVDLVRQRADQQPQTCVYTFLLDGETQEAWLSYSELDRQARVIAGQLQQLGAAGQRAMLLYPPGLDYIVAFFGCLYAGVTAVPVYPPQLNRPLPRLQGIIADSQATIALTNYHILANMQQRFAHIPELAALQWLATDEPISHVEAQWQPPLISGETLAFLQYTSGSTATPKGVMISHRNLLHNLSQIQRCFGHSTASRGVIWLPPYHDMGLIGGVLQPLYADFPVVLMAPVTFLQRPIRWLQAITRYQATTSGGPNFAYDLCVQKITPEQREHLDLSSWEVAFNGAEPIRGETLERFATTFASCGFRRSSLYPCYGLAEATLIVSGGQKDRAPVLRAIDAVQLERNQVVATEADAPDARLLVGCGQSLPDQEVAIVEPESLRRCLPGQVGEIWVAGPSVAQGYWDQPEETARTFGVHMLEPSAGPFLRTGDLGFFHEGELFVTGRRKDLIILRGRNHYPQDIELTVEQSHRGLRASSGAAFAVQVNGWEELVVVQEVERQYRNQDLTTVVTAIRQAIAQHHDVQAHTIVLVKPGNVPKTSSGKIQRSACRMRFLEGGLDILSQDISANQTDLDGISLDAEALSAIAPTTRRSWLSSELQRQLGGMLRLPGTSINPDQPIVSFGLDSLLAVELQHTIESRLGIVLPMATLLADLTITQLSEQILRLLPEQASAASIKVTQSEPARHYHLSYGQHALWFLHQVSPESSGYNIVSALYSSRALDTMAIEVAIQQLIQRHPVLRTTFSAAGGKPVQQVQPQISFGIQRYDATGWSVDEINQRLAADGFRHFDLEHGPLLRVSIYDRTPDSQILLFAVHHIVVDFWSLALLLREFGLAYSAARTGTSVDLPASHLQYADYIRWQTELLASERGGEMWAYWQAQLRGPLPVLNLPTDQPRPPVQTYRGAARTRILPDDLSEAVRALSREYGATLYTTLVSTFFVLLYRYSGQNDLLIGTPTAGRPRVGFADQVGYFVNPVVLRARLVETWSFEQVLAHVKQTVLAALRHQDYPFALLAEQLQPARDPSRPPLFQVIFVLQTAPSRDQQDLAALALGEEDVSIELGDLVLNTMALEQRAAPFDLTLAFAEVEGTLRASLQYNTDLFEAPSIDRMLGHFQTLLEQIVQQPRQSITTLSLLTAAEWQQLAEWNNTVTEYPRGVGIHQLFEVQAARTPHATAVVFNDAELSYAELNWRANQLADYLRSLGVGPGTLVGIFMERSLELMVGLFGILKAGGAYVPLDPSYPEERIAYMIEDAQLGVVLTQSRLHSRLPGQAPQVVELDTAWASISTRRTANQEAPIADDQLAYVIYTSGSTGRPKGVAIRHRNVVNFFQGMDQRVGCNERDTLLAVTSISFDISVLELFWTLARGAKVVLLAEQSTGNMAQVEQPVLDKKMQFSLFYFASDETVPGDKYRLLIEGTTFADQHEFTAVWTPERHFHAFGGLYPNPSVMSAALAVLTKQIQLRAGSVVLPLHHPLRVAEEWSLVDNLSHGRVGLAFASGWHADDFAFFPERYSDRKTIMLQQIEMVQRLWRGEQVVVQGGGGNDLPVTIFPKPVQADLPIWLTAAGNPETFSRAGAMGWNVLTHLLGQSLEDVAEKIAIYRRARAEHGHDPQAGHVTLMLHTFVGQEYEAVRELVRKPFTNYLRSSLDLIENLIKSLALPLDLRTMSEQDLDDLLAFAFDRYFETSALFGTPETCLPMINRLKEIGVDEVACLIDFGIDASIVLDNLVNLNVLREDANRSVARQQYPLRVQALRHPPTLLQSTPSMMNMLVLDPLTIEALHSLRVLMLGGEALPPALVGQVHKLLPCAIINMYGPTETTIWSATSAVERPASKVFIGRPIANTQIYILDQNQQPLPVGIAGELCIGGDGLAMGYVNRPDLTAEKFIPDLLSDSGAQLYRTGDLARYLSDGTLEFLGRLDQQVKIRGYRIELGEIEAVLNQHPAIHEAVVVVRELAPGDSRLVAYLVACEQDGPAVEELKRFISAKLPEYMLPSAFTRLEALPLTSNGKVDRKALAALQDVPDDQAQPFVAPHSQLEQMIAEIWRQVLKREQVGIHDNFFSLGGHSLLIAQVHNQLREVFQKDIPLVKLLEYPTISALAGYLDREQEAQPSFQSSIDRAKRQREAMRRRGRSS